MSSPRSLAFAEVREPRPRVRRHRVMAAVVTSYLAGAVAVVTFGGTLAGQRWLSLHLLGLGAATNAVFVWSRHFAQAVLHARLASERATHLRLVLLNVGVVAVLVGVEAGPAALAACGAAAVVLAVAWHVAALVAMARGHRLPGPLRRVASFYVAAGVSLMAGATLGGLMAGDLVADDSVTQQRLHLAHAELNLLGWIGLAVLGTSFVLWPAALRSRMLERAPAVAGGTLTACVAGLVALTSGAVVGSRAVAVAGCSAYAVGVLLAAVQMARTLRGAWPRGAAAWSLAAGVGWLLVGIGVDISQLAQTSDPDRVLVRVVPVLAVGLVAQSLVGALTFLLPVTIGGGPVGNRRLAALLERVAPVRVAAGNAGLALVVLPGSRAQHVWGWAAVLAGFGGFLPLVVVGLVGTRNVALTDSNGFSSGRGGT